MTWKTGVGGLVAAVAVGLSGCTTCHHKAAAWSYCPAAATEPCSAQRSRVHVFLVGGLDVFDDGGLKGLRDAANAAGFTQVYYGQPHHGGWFGREVRRIACDDPAARFVLVGYGLGAGTAGKLVADARGCGANVDALVLLDPHGLDDSLETPVHVFGSERWCPPGDAAGCEVTKLPGVSHFALATDPLTVEKTIGLLREAAARIPDDAEPVFALPMIDSPAPIPAVIPERPAGKVVSRLK